MKKPTKAVAKAKEIAQSFLMWVGAEHYTDIKSYSDEAIAYGISKRIPTVEMAKTLAEPGSVVFLAHDEGEYKDCSACYGEMECGECRKRNAEALAVAEEINDLRDGDTTVKGVPERIARLSKKWKALKAENKKCAECKGKSVVNGGTGGFVTVDGEEWDYRKYNYWLHQPKKWTPVGKKVKEHMCETCGGTGRLPEGKVFGLFLPTDLEWIVPADADAKVIAEMKARGFKLVPEKVLVTEPRRGCGKRKPGGVYVTTKADSDLDKKGAAILAELIESGVVTAEGVEVSGAFVRFVTPVPIEAKRFRGVKRWSLNPAAEREAAMIMEAMEA